MSEGGRPYPKNVPGPFYVEDGCCVTCGVMHDVAPTLLAWDDKGPNNSHCFVCRQPSNETEITQMLSAMLDSEMNCVRYRGGDRDVNRRIVEAGLATQLDVSRLPGSHPLVRNCVTFEAMSEEGRLQSPGDIASLFEIYLHSKAAEHRRKMEELEAHLLQLGVQSRSDSRRLYKFTELRIEKDAASFDYAWSDEFHSISASHLGASESGWLVRHSTPVSWTGISVSRQIHSWLTSTGTFKNIRWYSEAQWGKRTDWQPTPI